MRLALIISSLAAGGAERVMSILANRWVAGGHQVRLITLASRRDDFFALDPGVERIGLDLLGESRSPLEALAGNLRRLHGLRRALLSPRPQVVISFMDRTNVLTLLASRGLGLPVVVAERSNPWLAPMGSGWGLLRRLLYPRAQRVLAVNREGADFLQRWVDPRRVRVMPNPVPPEVADSAPLPPGDWPGLERTVVGMGRLSPEKGFDILVRAFAACRQRRRGWHLLILGDGPQRRFLERLVRGLGLEGAVRLPGNLPQPYGLLRRCGLFVMPSRYEGFPCGLVEAMACGAPVVASDCSSAVRRIIAREEEGVIVPRGQTAALARALDRLMADSARRRALGREALRIRRRYGLETIMEMWDNLLTPLLEGGWRGSE